MRCLRGKDECHELTRPREHGEKERAKESRAGRECPRARCETGEIPPHAAPDRQWLAARVGNLRRRSLASAVEKPDEQYGNADQQQLRRHTPFLQRFRKLE